KLALATGHSTAAENLMAVREARRLGIDRMVVTHPVSSMSIDQLKEAAGMGAYIEVTANQVLAAQGGQPSRFANIVSAIRAVGPDRVILSSDIGQPQHPLLTDGWKQCIDLLQKAGITAEEIQNMTRRNPARLLGLK